MTVNMGPAEQVRKGQADRVQQEDRFEPAQDRAAPGARRHLYIVHSAEALQVSRPMERLPPARMGKSQGMLDRSVQGQIGRMLRDVFSDVADDPVPERFVKLLEALEAREKQP